VANDSLAHNAHPNPEDRSGDLEHVGEITTRAVLPVTRLRQCAACGGRFSGRELYGVPENQLTFFEGDDLCRNCAHRHGVH
jgi:hypothetical protein